LCQRVSAGDHLRVIGQVFADQAFLFTQARNGRTPAPVAGGTITIAARLPSLRAADAAAWRTPAVARNIKREAVQRKAFKRF
jgi:hypothetical protein